MARLIGERPKHPMEQEMYDYIMKTLPDYIYALFCPKIEYEGSERELDVVLFVPHMGVFVLDYYPGSTMEVSEGRLRFLNRACEYVTFSPKRIKENRLAVEKYLQDKFRIKPFIYEMLWLPQFEISAEARNRSLNEIIGCKVRVSFIIMSVSYICPWAIKQKRNGTSFPPSRKEQNRMIH